MRGLFILFAFLVSLSSYAQSFTINNINYNVISSANKEVEARWYYGSGGDVILPSSVSNNGIDYTVTHIGQYIFSGKNLTSVIIPNTITSIGTGAFSSNKLVNVVIPNSVTSMGNFAFSNNNLLSSIQLSDKLEAIPYQAFVNSALTNLTIPASVKSIGDFAFQNNTKLAVLNLEEGLETIGYQVFVNNVLTTLKLPNSVKSIGAFSFFNNKIETLVLSENLTTIEQQVFANNTELTSITLPSKLSNISSYAFGQSITEVVSLNPVPPTLTWGSLHNAGVIDLTVVSGEAKTAYEAAFLWKDAKSISVEVSAVDLIGDVFDVDGLSYKVVSEGEVEVVGRAPGNNSTDIVIPSGVVYNDIVYVVTSIGTRAFDKNSLTSVVIGSTVENIKDFAFHENFLTSIDLPSSLKTVGKRSFRNNKLQEVFIPSGVTAIGFDAFSINQIEKITLPSSLTYLGSYSFYANRIKKVSVLSNIPLDIEGNVFGNIRGAELYVFSLASSNAHRKADVWKSFKTIEFKFESGGLLYSGISDTDLEVVGRAPGNNSTNIVIPSEVVYNDIVYVVTSIGTRAFDKNSLTSVVIGSTVENIKDFAFHENFLTSIDLPSSLKTVGKRSFRNNKLQEVFIPSGVTAIGFDAFSINQIEKITLPSSLTYLGSYSFYANRIKKVSVLSNIPLDIEGNVFGNIRGAELYVFSLASSNAHRKADVWKSFKTIEFKFESGGLLYSGISDTDLEVVGRAPGNNSTDIVIPSEVVYNDIVYVVTSIGTRAFDKNSLTSVVIGSTVENIKDFAFHENFLTSIDLPSSLKTVGKRSFRNNKLQEVFIPSGVTAIGFDAFSINQIEKITLPSSLTYLGSYSFYANRIKKVSVLSNIPLDIEGSVFGNIRGAELYVPSITAKSTYENTLVWQDFGSIIVDGEQENIPLVNNVNIDDLKLDLEASFTLNNYTNRLEIQPDTDDAIVERLELYNFNGALIKTVNDSSIDLTEFDSGMYILKVSTDKGEFVKRFFKQ
ncbi:leucine-rich repeat protein [Wenyingzhuangia sp. IMCC45574]